MREWKRVTHLYFPWQAFSETGGKYSRKSAGVVLERSTRLRTMILAR